MRATFTVALIFFAREKGDKLIKCSRHHDNDAVAQCTKCGAYVCSTCAEVTSAFQSEMGTLCIKCNGGLIGELITYYRERKAEKIKKIILSIIFYAIGIVLAIFPIKMLSGGGAVMLANPVVLGMLVGGVILCGFYTALSFAKDAQKQHDEYEQKNGVQYTITENGIYREKGTGTKVLYFLVGAVFGVALTPIMIFVYAIGIAVDNKHIKESQETLLELESI